MHKHFNGAMLRAFLSFGVGAASMGLLLSGCVEGAVQLLPGVKADVQGDLNKIADKALDKVGQQATGSGDISDETRKKIKDDFRDVAKDIASSSTTTIIIATQSVKPKNFRRLFESVLETDGFPASGGATISAKFLAQAIDASGSLVVWVQTATESGPYTFTPDSEDITASTYTPRMDVRGLDTFDQDVTGTSSPSADADRTAHKFRLDPTQNVLGLAEFWMIGGWFPGGDQARVSLRRFAIGKKMALIDPDPPVNGKWLRWATPQSPTEANKERWTILATRPVEDPIRSFRYIPASGSVEAYFSANTTSNKLALIGEKYAESIR